MNDAVLIDISGSIGIVRLNRPDVRNALNLAMCHELLGAMAALNDNADVKVILIEGVGKSFCAGADMKERVDKDEVWVRNRRLAAFAAYEQIERVSKPVIACVHGPVVGSGCEIALCADFIVASGEASFKFPEPQWGTVGATQRLQRAVGKRLAKDLLYTGRTLGAQQAFEAGLVTRLVPEGGLAAAKLEIAEAIAKAPSLAVSLTKQAVDLGEEVSISQGVRIELAAINHNLALGSWREGLQKFAEKPSRQGE